MVLLFFLWQEALASSGRVGMFSFGARGRGSGGLLFMQPRAISEAQPRLVLRVQYSDGRVPSLRSGLAPARPQL